MCVKMNSQIWKGKIKFSFLALPHETLSSGEFADQRHKWLWNQNNRLQKHQNRLEGKFTLIFIHILTSIYNRIS